MDFDFQRVINHPLMAGVGGAVVGVLRFAPGATWPVRVANAIAGIGVAWYVAPALGELFVLTSDATKSALSFAVGMFGMSIAAALNEGVRSMPWAEILTSWAKRRGE
jgi:hypothetical protein